MPSLFRAPTRNIGTLQQAFLCGSPVSVALGAPCALHHHLLSHASFLWSSRIGLCVTRCSTSSSLSKAIIGDGTGDGGFESVNKVKRGPGISIAKEGPGPEYSGLDSVS
ncbi:uncharacterized protein BDR25DRAFT_300496 [Lindgomyces ingoldianus]|uniref:Uncharacterized protein n=1 Tax=Lindgomyces ingoldianus TaxID=673940 RepID=A0ACB6RB38_9PLEO|nr:uncharacterized protein BDR25DRAFT_300496 [Lindgomyces ingoldianus]KAF2476538.1 hypothetical protein BDR25DRAFT_300496 [Lindgomyces ingoldianus]